MENTPAVTAGLKKAGASSAEAHLFLCLGPECAPIEEGTVVWDYLKKRVAEMGLKIMRTKAQCLRVCSGGPWLLVYPEGIWYGNITIERCERILREHLTEGKPITEWIAENNCLKKRNSDCTRSPNLQN